MKEALALVMLFAVTVVLVVLGVAVYDHNKKACERSGGVYQRRPWSKSMECVHH